MSREADPSITDPASATPSSGSVAAAPGRAIISSGWFGAWRLHARSRHTPPILCLSLVASLLLMTVPYPKLMPVQLLALAACLPLIPGALAVIALGSPMRAVERSLPASLLLRDLAGVIAAIALFALGVAIATGVATVVRGGPVGVWDWATTALGYAGLMLIWATIFDARLAWMPALLWLVLTLIPFINDETLLQHPPSGAAWWPVVSSHGAPLVTEFGLFLAGVVSYATASRADWQRLLRLPGR